MPPDTKKRKIPKYLKHQENTKPICTYKKPDPNNPRIKQTKKN
jgi:hypothetical protein